MNHHPEQQYCPIPVATAKEVAQRFRKDWVVILAYSRAHNLTHTTTYGVLPEDKVNAATAGEVAAKAIGCDTSKKDFNEDFRRRQLDAGKASMFVEACEAALNVLRPIVNRSPAMNSAIEKLLATIRECGAEVRTE